MMCVLHLPLHGQKTVSSDSEPFSTVVLFRTFDIFSFDRSYKLYASDSLLGRIKTKDVIILETYLDRVSLHAGTKAPSLNADKRTNYQKRKSINYPVTLKPGEVYFVKCGYLLQNLFDLPRQPTIRLLKPEEIGKYLRKKFVSRQIKDYLYDDWLTKNNLKRLE
ncbi:hypothetical protein WBG78_16440 [Chryseolinea sp. T2]|uniref:hypothetical protein n=1 Tax=Chryseolinea sp. T2 TaxID=3129255 RepID=UPI00307732CC